MFEVLRLTFMLIVVLINFSMQNFLKSTLNTLKANKADLHVTHM